MNRTQLTLHNNHLPLNNRTTFVPWLCLLLFFLLPVYVHSQIKNVIIPIKDVLIRVKLWTNKDGIPHWHLNGAFQDSHGILWANWKGTLCRFDGQRWLEVAQYKEGLHEFNSTDFAEDIHHNLWFTKRSKEGNNYEIHIYLPVQKKIASIEAYLGEGAKTLPRAPDKFDLFSIHQVVYIVNKDTDEMWRYDGELKRVLSPNAESMAPHAPNKYVPAANGCYWRLNQKHGAYLIDSSGQTLAHYPHLKWSNGQFALTDDLNLVYFSAAGTTEVTSQARQANPSPAQWFDLSYLYRGWCSHKQYRFAGLPYHAIVINPSNQIRVMKQEKVVVEDLFAFIQTQFLDYDFPLQMLSSGAHGTYCPMQLTDGTLLIPLQNGLLEVSLRANLFTPLLPGHNIRSLAALDHQLFIGQQNHSALTILNLEHQTQRHIPTNRSSIRSILPGAEGLWYGGYGNALSYVSASSSTTEFYTKPSSGKEKTQDQVKSILRVTDHMIWYAAGSGVVELDLKESTSRYVLHGVDVNHLSRDKKGAIWACTERGMYSFSQKRYYLDTLADGQRLNVVHLYEQNPGTFWLATHQGLIRWKPYSGEYRQFTVEDGMSEDILHAVYADKSGRLWISSNNGIMSFDLKTEEIKVYFEEDGLCHNEQNQGAHAQDAEGRLYFGSLAGVNAFQPDNIPSTSSRQIHHYLLHVERVSLYGRRGKKLADLPVYLNTPELYRLPRACAQLAIDLSLPYHGFEKIVVEWRLKQRGEKWHPLNVDNQLFLLQIPYGNFEIDFRVRIQNSRKILHNYQLAFYAPLPFYFSLFFWLFSFLVVTMLAALVFLLRTRAIKANNRALQAEVVKRTRELEVQTRKLERVDVAKTQLFNNVSHELRTPLSLIQLSAEHLPGQKIPEQKQLVGQIKEQVRYITRMLEEIIDLSRLEMGLIKVEPEVVNWQSFFNQNFWMLESMARHKEQDYQLKIQPAKGMYLFIDKDKVAHVLNNLIGNAIKYTPVGGRILVRSELTASEVEVVVADTGPGIPQEEQEDIFRRYYQGRHTVKQAQPGYGIGLALCKEYAELMGGRVWVESVPGEGASFFFCFPRVDAPHEEVLTAPAATEVAISRTPRTFSRIARADTSKNRIMVVEDNLELLALLEDILSEDYEVQLATNGEEAFELLQQQPDAFQLVLSDIMMPVVDGFGLLSKVRAHPKLGFIPFLFLSALSAQEDQLKALRLGVDAFISKPFETFDLKTRIRSMIRNQELRKKYLLSSTTDAQGQAAKASNLSNQEDGAGEAISYNEAWLRELEAIVRKNLAQHDLKIQDIAFQLHISERTLRTYINTYTGLSPVEYLKKARLSHAMQLIRQRKYRTVGEIAYAVGFKDASYFSKAFKQEFGKFPMD